MISEPSPIRLKVAYKTPASLLHEFTRSIGKGGVGVRSPKRVAVGTRFLFELYTKDAPRPVEVVGEVISVTPSEEGRFLLNVRYDVSEDRSGLDALLHRLYQTQEPETTRRFVRVPLNLRATEETAYSASFLVRDISSGGLGIELEAPQLTKEIRLGAPCALDVTLSSGTLSLPGEIAWINHGLPLPQKWLNPTFGVRFSPLAEETRAQLDRILQLRGLPPAPWRARIRFGSDAFSRPF